VSERSRIIDGLIGLSRELGRDDRRLAILAEGNTSARTGDDTFLVKASGANLATRDDSGLVECRFEPLLKLLDGDVPDDPAVEAALMNSRVDPGARKPSVEAVFHAFLLTLPGVGWVGHTHPVEVLGLLCSPSAEAFAGERRFPDEIVCCGARSALAPYVDPGVPLARVIVSTVREFMTDQGHPPRVLLLENHGLIAPGASPQAVLAATLMCAKSAGVFATARASGGVRPLSPPHVRRISDRPDEHHRRRELNI
jgi:rhamnose utilization protein RhaD (predicted bifunctional aldolase and dehydrogenase)